MKEFTLEVIFAIVIIGFLASTQTRGPEAGAGILPDSATSPDAVSISNAVFGAEGAAVPDDQNEEPVTIRTARRV